MSPARLPAHRRKPDPYARHVLGVSKPPRLCKCAHPLVRHEERIGGQLVQGPCNVQLCGCLGFREAARKEHTDG